MHEIKLPQSTEQVLFMTLKKSTETSMLEELSQKISTEIASVALLLFLSTERMEHSLDLEVAVMVIYLIFWVTEIFSILEEISALVLEFLELVELQLGIPIKKSSLLCQLDLQMEEFMQ